MTNDKIAALKAVAEKSVGAWIDSSADITYRANSKPNIILSLIERLEAEEKDAARYRWLRLCGDEFANLSVFDSRGNIDPDSLDEAIDAAMIASNKPDCDGAHHTEANQ